MNPTRTNLKRFVLAAAAAATLSFVAHAQSMPGHEPPGGMMRPHGHHEMMPPLGEGGMPPYLRGINLSETQQDKIFNIFHNNAQQMREQAKAVKKAHEELHELAFAEQYDEGRAKALAEASGKAMAEMALLRARIDRQVLAVLTPEQRQSISGKNFR